MYLSSKEVAVILNIIHASPRELVALLPATYRRVFGTTDVPVETNVRNRSGDVSLVMINKKKAIHYLKDKYGFLSEKEITKEVADARSNL
jgi:hypothetical protein